MEIRYAIVESAGRHGSGDAVRARYTSADLARAQKLADRMTRDYQRAMKGQRGSYGGYVVVICPCTMRSGDVLGLGHEVDRMPRV